MNDVLAARSGDLQAFGRLVDHWSTTVTSIALGILGDIGESEEVAQDVFVAVWQKLGSLDNPASFGAWVRQITRNRALTHRRARTRRWARVVPDSDADAVAPDDADERAVRQQVQDALDALPDDARDVMILFYREDQSVRQVADLLELSEAAVKKRLSRARKVMREDLHQQLGIVLAQSTPAAAFTLSVLASLTPASATAAVATSTTATFTPALGMGTALLLVVLGYRLAEGVTPTERHPLLHRARNLTLVGLTALLAGSFTGGVWPFLGFGVAATLLTYVQFGLLPRAFATDTPSWAARIGRICGVVGLFAGLTFGLAGILHGG